MGVKQVKNSMNKLNIDVNNAINSLNSLMSVLSSVSIETTNSLHTPISRTFRDLDNLNSSIKEVYKITSVELHIFFKQYNTLLANSETYILQGAYDLTDLYTISKTYDYVYQLYLSTEFVLYVGYDEKYLTDYLSDLRTLKNKLEQIKQETIINNNKLIIKNVKRG